MFHLKTCSPFTLIPRFMSLPVTHNACVSCLAVGFSPGWREGSSRATCLLLTHIRNSGPVEEPYHVPWSHLPVSSRPLRLKPQLPENKQVSCISCIISEKQASCIYCIISEKQSSCFEIMS